MDIIDQIITESLVEVNRCKKFGFKCDWDTAEFIRARLNDLFDHDVSISSWYVRFTILKDYILFGIFISLFEGKSREFFVSVDDDSVWIIDSEEKEQDNHVKAYDRAMRGI